MAAVTICNDFGDPLPPQKKTHHLFIMGFYFKKIKSRDITLPTKVHLVKAMVFPMVMYG